MMDETERKGVKGRFPFPAETPYGAGVPSGRGTPGAGEQESIHPFAPLTETHPAENGMIPPCRGAAGKLSCGSFLRGRNVYVFDSGG